MRQLVVLLIVLVLPIVLAPRFAPDSVAFRQLQPGSYVLEQNLSFGDGVANAIVGTGYGMLGALQHFLGPWWDDVTHPHGLLTFVLDIALFFLWLLVALIVGCWLAVKFGLFMLLQPATVGYYIGYLLTLIVIFAGLFANPDRTTARRV